MKVRLLLNDPQNSYNPSPLIDILAPLCFKRFQLPALRMAVNAWQKHVRSSRITWPLGFVRGFWKTSYWWHVKRSWERLSYLNTLDWLFIACHKLHIFVKRVFHSQFYCIGS